MDIWQLDKLYLFIIFVVPGFVSLKTYELIFPHGIVDSSKQIVDAVAYSCINYAILIVPIIIVENSNAVINSPKLYLAFYLFVLLVSPILIVIAWKFLRLTQFAQKNAPHPTAKPWDYVFAQRKSYWVKVVLHNGTIIGGLYSGKSFASSAPACEQIYLEQTWV